MALITGVRFLENLRFLGVLRVLCFLTNRTFESFKRFESFSLFDFLKARVFRFLRVSDYGFHGFGQIILRVGGTVQFRSTDRLLSIKSAKYKKMQKRAEKTKNWRRGDRPLHHVLDVILSTV